MDRFRVTVDPELASIMDRYMEIRRRELDALNAALRAGDGETVSLLGHRLKGSGASYGFDRLTELGAALEKAGKRRDLAAAGKLALAIRHYIEYVDIVYGE